MSQIAGRAGRYKNDGGFGTTGDCETLNSDEIEKIEKHQLPSTKAIYWRNSKLDFKNPESLISTLELKPAQKNLIQRIMIIIKEEVYRVQYIHQIKINWLLLFIIKKLENHGKH